MPRPSNNPLASCPISTKRVDSNMVRLVSFQVASFSVVLLLTQEVIFAFLLLYDFMMRTFRLSYLSPFHQVGKFILASWNISPKLCDESPKRFALYLGLAISFLLAVLYTVGLGFIATSIAIMLFICALLETAFDFCIGCKIYYGLQLLREIVKK